VKLLEIWTVQIEGRNCTIARG